MGSRGGGNPPEKKKEDAPLHSGRAGRVARPNLAPCDDSAPMAPQSRLVSTEGAAATTQAHGQQEECQQAAQQLHQAHAQAVLLQQRAAAQAEQLAMLQAQQVQMQQIAQMRMQQQQQHQEQLNGLHFEPALDHAQQQQPQQPARSGAPHRRTSDGGSTSTTRRASSDAAGGGGGGGGAANGDDHSKLTVMQKYHLKRKQQMQKMEADVAHKLEELNLLQRENLALRARAEVLENMLVDVDKQLELMSAVDTPASSDWVTLMRLGHAHGRPMARWLHRVLERGAAIDTSAWTLAEPRRRWAAFVERLRPLLAEADALQRTAAEAAFGGGGGGDGHAAADASGAPWTRRSTRRSSAAAAAGGAGGGGGGPRGDLVDALIEAARAAARDRVRAAAGAGGDAAALSAAGGGAAPMVTDDSRQSSVSFDSAELTRAHAGDLHNSGPLPSVPETEATDGGGGGGGDDEGGGAVATATAPAAGAADAAARAPSIQSLDALPPDAAGVPLELYRRISEVVEDNFVWLIAMLRTNFVLTMEFISSDVERGSAPLPPPSSQHWDTLLKRLKMSREQLREGAASYEMAARCQAAVAAEREAIQRDLKRLTESSTPADADAAAQAIFSDAGIVASSAHAAALERVRANMRKEGVVRNMVGFYNLNVLSRMQLARLCAGCWPWFPMAWSVIGAARRVLDALPPAPAPA